MGNDLSRPDRRATGLLRHSMATASADGTKHVQRDHHRSGTSVHECTTPDEMTTVALVPLTVSCRIELRRRVHCPSLRDVWRHLRADAIRRSFTTDAARINQRWCGDIAYLATWEGWLYQATVIDIASRRVVRFALPITCAPS